MTPLVPILGIVGLWLFVTRKIAPTLPYPDDGGAGPGPILGPGMPLPLPTPALTATLEEVQDAVGDLVEVDSRRLAVLPLEEAWQRAQALGLAAESQAIAQRLGEVKLAQGLGPAVPYPMRLALLSLDEQTLEASAWALANGTYDSLAQALTLASRRLARLGQDEGARRLVATVAALRERRTLNQDQAAAEASARARLLTNAEKARLAAALRSTVIQDIFGLEQQLRAKGAPEADLLRARALRLLADAPPIATIPEKIDGKAAGFRLLYQLALGLSRSANAAQNQQTAEILIGRGRDLSNAGFPQHGAFLARRGLAILHTNYPV